jgi:Patatin-like phospholipase
MRAITGGSGPLGALKGPAIFAQTRSGIRGWLGQRVRSGRRLVWAPKYSAQPLHDALHEILGERKLGEAQTRLVIPPWHPQTQGVYIFKTAHHPRLKTDYKELAIDAAMATAAAPTYFAQHVTANDVGLVDGVRIESIGPHRHWLCYCCC